MRFITFMALTLVVTLGGELSAQAAIEKATCKVKTNDIGTIIGRGKSSSDAFEDAATQCFERRAQLHRMKKSKDVDEDAGLVMIDTCANIRCAS